MSSKCLDLDYLSYFQIPSLEVKIFQRDWGRFMRDDSEPIVTLGYKAKMTSSKWLDFNYFALFSCTLLRS